MTGRMESLNIVDNRTPEQLEADGDRYWPNGLLYTPPGQPGPLESVLLWKNGAKAYTTLNDGRIILVEYCLYNDAIDQHDGFWLFYDDTIVWPEPDDIHIAFASSEKDHMEQLREDMDHYFDLDIDEPIWILV